MLKYILIVIKAGWYVLYIYPAFLYYRITKNKTPYEKRYAKVKKSITKLARLLDVQFHITGLEKLDPNKNYYVVSNHQSLFDALSLIIVMNDRYLRPIAKEESIKMPIAGKMIQAIDSLLLDRDDPRQALKLMKEAGNILTNENQSVLVFPEGTRSKNKEHTVNDFKAGSLKPIYYAKSEVVPVCLVDTHQILSFKIWKRKYHIQIEFLDPIPFEEISSLQTQELADKLKDKISNKYNELKDNKF